MEIEHIMNTSNATKRAYLFQISAMAIMGTIGVFREFIPFSSALIVLSRGVIGSLCICIFLLLTRKFKFEKYTSRQLATMIATGAFLGINWVLLFEGYRLTTVATATLCNYLAPSMVILLSPLAFKEKLTAKKILCALAALFGMVLVSGILTENVGFDSRDFIGAMLAAGAAIFYALMVIANKKTTGVAPYPKTVIQLLSSAAVVLPYFLLTEDFGSITWSLPAVGLTLVVCVVHTGIAYVMYFGSMCDLPSQTIATLSYIDPIIALIAAWAVLGETMSIPSIIGAVLILGAAFVGETNFKKR